MTNTANGNGGGYCVRMPRPRQLDRAAAVFGAARFHEFEDADALVKRALDDGTLKVEWDYIAFAEDPMPVPVTVPGAIRYGQNSSDPDYIITTTDRYSEPTWRPVRPGRTPQRFPTREAATEKLEDHREEAEAYGVPLGNLKLAQVVEWSQFEADSQGNPRERSVQRRHRRELSVLEQQVEDARAQLAAAKQPPSEPEQHEPVPDKFTDEWKAAIVAAVGAGEGTTSVARRFGTSDRQVRRYVERAKGDRPPPEVEAVVERFNES